MLDELSLFKKVIFSVENGEVTTIVGPNVSSLRRWLDNETVPNRERPILLLERITKIPCLDSLLDNYIHTLAEAALRLWPVWYTDIDLSRFDASASGIRGIHAAFESIGAQNCKISAVWARKAIVPVLSAHPPMLTGFSNAEQVQQADPSDSSPRGNHGSCTGGPYRHERTIACIRPINTLTSRTRRLGCHCLTPIPPSARSCS